MFRSIYWYGKGYAWTLIKSLSDIKKINKMEAIFNNIIALFYHKKTQKRRDFSLHFQFFSV